MMILLMLGFFLFMNLVSVINLGFLNLIYPNPDLIQNYPDGFVARSISLLPGGPGSRSTTNPAACMARLTLPFAE